MNTPTLPTIQLTEDWEKFFRDYAQFIPPLDRVHDARDLDPFKLWGRKLWDTLKAEQKDFEGLEHQLEEAQLELKQFKESVLKTLDEAIRLCS